MNATWPDFFSPRVVGLRNGSSGLSTVCIALEAWRRGLEVTFTRDNLQEYTVSDGRRVVEFNYSRPESITRKVDYQKLDRKSDTIEILRKHDVPTPAGIVIEPAKTSLEGLKEQSDQLGYPLVIKPDIGSYGAGVLTGLSDWEELKSGYEYLISEFKPARVVMEKHHEGDDHRLLVVGDRVVSAARRVPAHVIGDGRASIAKLIESKNAERQKNPFLTSGPIKVDYEVEKCLAEQQLCIDDVPEAETYVTLRRVANASAGGDIVDVTDELPSEVKTAAVKAVKAIPHVVVAGVDILFDPRGAKNDYVVIEINSRPHIGVNMFPSVGTGQDVPNAIFETLFPGSRRPRFARLKTLRFDKAAITEAIRSGITSTVVLPAIPRHLYLHRQQVSFAPLTGDLSKKTLPRQSLLRTAHQHGVVGSVRRNRTGGIDMILAAQNEQATRPVVDRIREWSGAEPANSIEWRGVVTASFTVGK